MKKRVEILHGCPFEGWSNRTRSSYPFWQKLADWLNWLYPVTNSVRSALKRTPVQNFNHFSIMFNYIFSTTYERIGDLFCSVIFLDFRTVCNKRTEVEKSPKINEPIGDFQEINSTPKLDLQAGKKSWKRINGEHFVKSRILKLRHCEKAKKFEKISYLFWRLLTPVL